MMTAGQIGKYIVTKDGIWTLTPRENRVPKARHRILEESQVAVTRL